MDAQPLQAGGRRLRLRVVDADVAVEGWHGSADRGRRPPGGSRESLVEHGLERAAPAGLGEAHPPAAAEAHQPTCPGWTGSAPRSRLSVHARGPPVDLDPCTRVYFSETTFERAWASAVAGAALDKRAGDTFHWRPSSAMTVTVFLL